MLGVVDFLEKIGSDAQWRGASQDDMASALAEANIEAPVRAAILAKDEAGVRTLLGQKNLIDEYVPSPIPEREPDEEGDEEEGDEKDG
jgi:hypothetical protein